MPWTNPPITWPRSMSGLSDSAEVHQDVDPRHRELAGQPVDHHLGDGGAIGEVKERVAPARLAIEIDPRRRIKAPRAQVDALFVGQPDELSESRAGSRAGGCHAPPRARSGCAWGKARSHRRPTRNGARPPRRAGPSRSAAARRAAVPFKSVLADAAVGEVLLFFSVEAGMTRTDSSGKANSVGDDLANLGVEPLPHLGPARRDLDRAVEIDVDQRIGLVECPPRERDPELDRRQCDAREDGSARSR